MESASVTRTRGQAAAGNLGLWLAWVLASAAGYFIALVVSVRGLQLLLAARVHNEGIEGQLIFVAAALVVNALGGAIVGRLQLLVLRRRMAVGRGWVIWTMLAWMFVGEAIIFPLASQLIDHLSFMIWTGAVLGTVIGVCQWAVLRRVVKRAGWWIAASALGWLLGFSPIAFLSTLARQDPVLILVLALQFLVLGAVTGVALIVLSETPLSRP